MLKQQPFLQALVTSHDRIIKKEPLTDIDRAFLDYPFHRKQEYYTHLKRSTELTDNTLKRIIRLLHDEQPFRKKEDQEFMAFISWAWAYDISFDDITLENEEKTLHLQLTINHTQEKPEFEIFLIATKKHEQLTKKIAMIIQADITSN